jgi:hypothetical protein
VAAAASQGFPSVEDGVPSTYSGYHFHVLCRQGGNGSGGARSYLVAGRMTLGFAFLAYPAEYRSTGVMSFMVNRDGVVYQRDFGKDTQARARALDRFDPDANWEKVSEVQLPF